MSSSSYPTTPVDFFQLQTDLCSLTHVEWAQIRRIAKELYDAEMFGKDQFKIAVEAYHRWLAMTQCNEDLVDEIYGKIPGFIQ